MTKLDDRVLGYCWFTSSTGTIGIVLAAISYKGMRAYLMQVDHGGKHNEDLLRIMDRGAKFPVLEAVSLINKIGHWEPKNIGINIDAISSQGLMLHIKTMDQGPPLVRLADKISIDYGDGGDRMDPPTVESLVQNIRKSICQPSSKPEK